MTKASQYWIAGTIFLSILGGNFRSFVPHPQAAARLPIDQQTTQEVPSPLEIINAVNQLRTSHGIPALPSHPVLMKIAQEEANGIAGGMPGHWRPYGLTLEQWLIMEGYPLGGDLSLGGYRSENWASALSEEQVFEIINSFWSPDLDPLHANTMLSTNRSDIGAGVAVQTDEWGQEIITFVIETAMQTSSGRQQHEANLFLTSLPDYKGGTTSINGTEIPLEDGQYIIPVAINTAHPNGEVYHQVKFGQSLWSIAITYGTTIKEIQRLNNLGENDSILTGQNLLVMINATQSLTEISATVTPTPVPDKKIPSPQSALYEKGNSITATPQEMDAKVKDQDQNSFVIWAVVFAALALVGVFISTMRVKQ